MERLEIFALNKEGGVFEKYVDVASLMAFFNRTGRMHSYQVILTKGKRCANLNGIKDPKDMVKQIYEFERGQ